MIEQPGNRVCCLSWRPDRPPDPVRLASVFRDWTLRHGPGWLIACERADCLADTARGLRATGTARLFDRDASRLVGPADLAGKAMPDVLHALAAPAVAAWQDGADVCMATDTFGIGQAFWFCHDGMAAAATSATLIADLFGLRLDREALTGFALTGSFIADRTAFHDVRKLMAGHRCRLRDGDILVAAWRSASSSPPAASLEDVAETFRSAVEAMVSAAPDADIELSGGIDSRLILAAIRRPLRPNLRSVTIGRSEDEDVLIARRIAQANAMGNVRIDPADLSGLSASAFGAALAAVAQGYDHAANPIDKLPLVLAGAQFRSAARLGGQNGEILRGFYYLGQPLADPPSERLARNLVRWRLRANDQVSAELLGTEDFSEREAAVERALVARLMEMGGTWGETLDRFYLAERMQRWVGASVNNRFAARTSLYPFFDTGFLAAAMALKPEEKRGDGLARALLVRLDETLAVLPLEGGRGIPLNGGSLRGALAKGAHLVGKAGARIRRQIAGRSRPTLGSASVIAQWRAQALYNTLPLDALAESGLVAPAALDRIANGAWAPDRASLGFVLMLSSIVERSSCSVLR